MLYVNIIFTTNTFLNHTKLKLLCNQYENKAFFHCIICTSNRPNAHSMNSFNWKCICYIVFLHLWTINHCASFLTLCYRWGGVGAVRELVGGNAGHGWRWETPWDQVIKCHQLIGSCLLPPPRPPVAEPNLEGQWWQHLINVCYLFQIIH